MGVRGGVVVKALRYKQAGRGFFFFFFRARQLLPRMHLSLRFIVQFVDLSTCLSTQYNMQNEWTYAAA
jgi:hypothetical protein